jgi:probable rRNA maturation factor
MIEVEVSVGGEFEPPVSPERIEAVVRWALRHEAVKTAELSVVLLDDAEIARMNRQYLKHEGPTDVISFTLHHRGDPPLGDVYVGVEQAVRQAAELGVSPAEEVLRLAVHGTLHVLGYDHPKEAGRAESQMFARQEALLKSFLAAEPGA